MQIIVFLIVMGFIFWICSAIFGGGGGASDQQKASMLEAAVRADFPTRAKQLLTEEFPDHASYVTTGLLTECLSNQFVRIQQVTGASDFLGAMKKAQRMSKAQIEAEDANMVRTFFNSMPTEFREHVNASEGERYPKFRRAIQGALETSGSNALLSLPK